MRYGMGRDLELRRVAGLWSRCCIRLHTQFMMRAGASGAFRQRAIVLPAGSAHKERPSPRAQTGHVRTAEDKERVEPRLAPLIFDSAPSCHAILWLRRSHWPAVCCGAPLCYAPESCRVHAPPNPTQGLVRLHRRPRHVFASHRAATQSPRQSTHRMFPAFVADLGRGSPHLRSWPAAATPPPRPPRRRSRGPGAARPP